MSYETVREHIVRCRQAAQQGDPDNEHLLQALEQLTVALESDLTQVKAALSHLAWLLEDPQD